MSSTPSSPSSSPDQPSTGEVVLGVDTHAQDDHVVAVVSPLFTVASLAPVDLDRAQLAYLSACHTATILDTGLLDEAIHLTSAFQLAGFRHVIGTLWSINDKIAAAVADEFYTRLRNGPHTLDTSRAAHALHHAIRAIREGHDVDGLVTRIERPSLWAAYFHTGA